MPRFCANLTTLFTERPLLERVEAARAAGFEAVEILFPYDDPAPRLLERLDAAGLPLALINGPPPNYAGGPRGFAAVPGREERFRNDFRRAARLAATLGAQHLHVMAGGSGDGAEGEDARRAFVENLRWAASAAPRQRLTIEPLSPGVMPGYFLNSFDLACEVLDEVGAPTLGLQFDTHHAAALEGDVHAAWARLSARVTHVQVAGAGRHEPDDPDFLRRLDRDGYGGWVSGEYAPRGRTEDGLGWLRA